MARSKHTDRDERETSVDDIIKEEAEKLNMSEDEVRKIVHDHQAKIGRKGRATMVKNLLDRVSRGEPDPVDATLGLRQEKSTK